MAEYRKKPVVIEAHKWNPHEKPTDTPPWLMAFLSTGPTWENGAVVIDTLEGQMLAQPGDYIIQGVEGELYPCKPSIFEATYEPVEAP